MDKTTHEISKLRDGINTTLRDIEEMSGLGKGSISLPDGMPHIVEFKEVPHYHSAGFSLDFYSILGADGGVYTGPDPIDSVIMKFSEGPWIHIIGSDITFCKLGDISTSGVGMLSELPQGSALEELDKISIRILILQLLSAPIEERRAAPGDTAEELRGLANLVEGFLYKVDID